MVSAHRRRTAWIGSVVGLLAWTGPALGQPFEAFTGIDDYAGGHLEREALEAGAVIEEVDSDLTSAIKPSS